MKVCDGAIYYDYSYSVFAKAKQGNFLLIALELGRWNGRAQVAVANDAYASYWNPAGLDFLKGKSLL